MQERAVHRRQEEQEAAARKAERTHIDAYLNALTPQERQALEERAVAHADDNMRQPMLVGGPLAEVARRALVDREVLRSPILSPLNRPSPCPPAISSTIRCCRR